MRLREIFERVMRSAFEKRYGASAFARWKENGAYTHEVVEAAWSAFQEGAEVQPDAWEDE